MLPAISGEQCNDLSLVRSLQNSSSGLRERQSDWTNWRRMPEVGFLPVGRDMDIDSSSPSMCRC